MAVAPLLLALLLLLHGCRCSPEPAATEGCLRWDINGAGVCCNECQPGHRVVRRCGKQTELCTPCEHGTYTLDPTQPRCFRCRECVGALVELKACTTTADTVCGCREGLTCADQRCSYCVYKCAEGQEPTSNGTCRPCPGGTFNDQKHQRCKPWSTKCPKPNQVIESKGDAFSDIKCVDIPDPKTVTKPDTTDTAEQAWSLIVPMIAGTVLVMLTAIIVAAVVKTKKTPKKPIVRPHSDDPQTLRSIAIECSFHEAEQEQGSSSESLDSKDSSEQLIGA